MNISNEELIQKAIADARAGKKEAAKKTLAQVIKQEPQNARAWYLLSQVIDKHDQIIYCLERVLKIKPNNQQALQRLEFVKEKEINSGPNEQNIDHPSPSKRNTVWKGNLNAQKVKPIQGNLTARKNKKNVVWIITIILVVVICTSIMFVNIFNKFNFGTTESVTSKSITSKPARTLSEVALTKYQIANIMGIDNPQDPISPEKACSNMSETLECYELGFVSMKGDLFNITLARFENQEDAKDYGFGYQVALERRGFIDLHISSGSHYRWLMIGSLEGIPLFYGGASKNGISIISYWGRTSGTIPQLEAKRVYYQIMDAQILKIEE